MIKDFEVSYVSANHHRLDFMIGPGKALDTTKYFVIATDAIGNGLTTSPSNSTAQPRMRFPKFRIRDMVQSQHRLLKEHLGIDRVVAVVGPSVGGMQALQWAVSHPDFMDGVVALVPLARTPAWCRSSSWTRRARRSCRTRRGTGGNYTSPPANCIRLPVVGLRRARSRQHAGHERRPAESAEVDQGEDRDHDRRHHQSRVGTGHAAAGGAIAADVEQINAETTRFLDVVTQRGERLR